LKNNYGNGSILIDVESSQASRLHGVNPGDVSVLLVRLEKMKRGFAY